MKSIEIFLNYTCNYKCNFCFEFNEKKSVWFSFEEIKEMITNWFNDWSRHIIFSWWEPSLDKNIFDYIKLSKNIGYKKIWIHTNWFKFKDKWYLDKLYSNWLTGVVLSIHWLYKINDLITGIKWSFDDFNKWLINLSKIKFKDNNFIIDTNTVICKQNKDILDKLFLYLLKFPISKRLFSFPNSTQFINKWIGIIKNMKHFMIKYEDVKEKLFFINNIKKKYFIKSVMLEWIPYCMVDKELYWFLEWWEKQWKKELYSKNIYNWENDKDHSYIKNSECEKCEYNYKCYWYSKDYVAYYWEKLLFNKNFNVWKIK